MLGLGLGLNKGTNLLSNLKLLTRNSDFAFWGDKATGISKGLNSPATNPIQDLVGNADGTLQGFAFTTASGYVDVVAPNGKTVTGIQGDGVNDVILLPSNAPNIDITGTGDFALACVTKLNTQKFQYLYSVGNTTTLTATLFGLHLYNTGRVVFRNGSADGITIGADNTLQNDIFYSMLLYRKNGRLKFRINKSEIYNQLNSTNLQTSNFKRIGCRINSADGTAHSDFINGTIGCMKIINGAITPFTEAQLIKDWDSFCSKVYGL